MCGEGRGRRGWRRWVGEGLLCVGLSACVGSGGTPLPHRAEVPPRLEDAPVVTLENCLRGEHPRLHHDLWVMGQQLPWADWVSWRVMVAVEPTNASRQTVEKLVQDGHAGGVMLLGTWTTADAREYITGLREIAMRPLWVAVDAEPGLLTQRVSDAPVTRWATEHETCAAVAKTAQVVADWANDVGVEWVFAPVVDRPGNRDVIGQRAWRDTPDCTATDKALVWARTLTAAGVLPTVKHYPGHGEIAGDSHTELVTIEGAMTELENFEAVLPASGAVMLGHILLKNHPVVSPEWPASVHPQVARGALRHEAGYGGVSVTDALNMVGFTAVVGDDHDVLLGSGTDVFLMPSDPAGLHQRLVADTSALNRESVRRLGRWKLCVGGE